MASIGDLVGPSQHCPLHHQLALQLSPTHEPNRWPINWSQKRQQRIRAKAMKIKIESLMVGKYFTNEEDGNSI